MAKIIIGGKEFEVSNEDITKSLEENKEIKIEADLVIREKTEEETFVQNLKNESKRAGIEIAVKEARQTLGLDFQGKTIDNLIEAVKTKTLEEAKVEPNKKVDELTKDLNTLKNTISTLENEKTQISEQFNSFKSERIITDTIVSSIPANIVLPKEDMTLLLKNKVSFKLDENSNVVALGQNGDVLKNPTTLEPLKPSEVINDFFSKNTQYIKSAEGGAGGGDDGAGGSKIALSKFIEEQRSKGHNPSSAEFVEELNKLTKSDLIDMNA